MRPHEIALKYIGQTEKPGNMGFNDAEFEAKMKDVGFKQTHAWCAYFCELVFKEAIPERFNEFDRLFSASAVQTFKNFRDAAYPIGPAAQLDTLVIWQNYKDGKAHWTGHAGIVSKVKSTWEFESVEGNTNSQGGREGFEVAVKDRKVLAEVTNGLKVLGFIQISKPVMLTI
jgi:hypothetical protein